MDAVDSLRHENACGVYTRIASFRDWIAEKIGM